MMRGCAIVCLVTGLGWASETTQLQAARAALDRGDYPQAIEQAEQAGSAFRAAHDLANEAQSLDIAGSGYLYSGDYDQALDRFQHALELDRRQHDSKGEITRLTNIGSVYFYRGQYSEALAEYQLALQRGGSQLVLSNLAMLHEQLGEDAKALDFYQKALDEKPSGELLFSVGTLERRMGEPEKALEDYRLAQSVFAQEKRTADQVRALEATGAVQAVDLHNLPAAVDSFSRAITLAGSAERASAHLFRGEALYRMKQWKQAADDFRAAGPGWMASYELGRIAQQEHDGTRALQNYAEAVGAIQRAGGAPESSDFLPSRRSVYDAAISVQLSAGPERLFALVEQALNSPQPAALRDVQGKLAPGSLLVEYWVAGGKMAAIWATNNRSGIVSGAWTGDRQKALDGVPLEGVRQLLVVTDAELDSLPFEAIGTPPLIERFAVSYLPYGSFLVRDEPWRTPLLPWRIRLAAFGPLPPTIADRLTGRVTIHAGGDNRKESLYHGDGADAPLLYFAATVSADPKDPARDHIPFAQSSLYRGEAQRMSLGQADVAVFASCDEGAGRTFGRAFLTAGARAVVAPLWTVPEGPAADLLARFYDLLGRGESKAEALRHAKLSCLHSGTRRADPKFWAAFVLMGDGQQPERPLLSWIWIAGPVLGAAGLILLLRRR